MEKYRILNESNSWALLSSVSIGESFLSDGDVLKDGDVVTIKTSVVLQEKLNLDVSGGLFEQIFTFSLPDDFVSSTAIINSPTLSSFEIATSEENEYNDTEIESSTETKDDDTETGSSTETKDDDTETGSSTETKDDDTETEEAPKSDLELQNIELTVNEQTPLGAPDINGILELVAATGRTGYTDYTVYFTDEVKQSGAIIEAFEFSVSFVFEKVDKTITEIPELKLPNGESVVYNYNTAKTGIMSITSRVGGVLSGTNIGDKIQSAEFKLFRRQYTDSGAIWPEISIPSVDFIFDTSEYRLTVDWELNNAIKGEDIKPGDYFEVVFPEMLNVTGIDDFNILYGSDIVGTVEQHPTKTNVKLVVFNDVFSSNYKDELEISGNLKFEFYFESKGGTEPITWQFSAGGQTSNALTGTEGPPPDNKWNALPLHKAGGSKRNEPQYMFHNEWTVFVNREGTVYENATGVLVDEWDENQEISDFYGYCTNDPTDNASNWFLANVRNGSLGNWSDWYLSLNNSPDLPHFLILEFDTNQMMADLGLNGMINAKFDTEMFRQIDYIYWGKAGQSYEQYLAINKGITSTSEYVTSFHIKGGANRIATWNYEPNSHKVTFEFEEGAFNNGQCYIIMYTTRVTDELASEKYTNKASFTISGETKDYNAEVVGTGSGTATARYGYFTIHKTDDNENSLSSAKFTLTKPDNTTVILETQNNGVASVFLNSTFVGKCILEETMSPSGYELLSGKVEFTVKYDEANKRYVVDGDNYKTSVGSSTDLYDNITKYNYNGASGLIIKNDPLPSQPNLPKITIKKADDKEKFISGAKFQITGSNNFLKENIEIDNEDGIEIELPGMGSYVLTETKSPSGYKILDNSISFNVDNSGIISLSGESNEYINITGNSLTVYNELKPIDIIIKKTDSEKFINGAKFEITGPNDFLEDNIEIDSEDGFKVTLPGIGSYVLTETESPSGYHGVAPITFEVNDKGEISFDTDYDYALINGNTLTIINSRENQTIHLVKEGVGENSIAGTIFEIKQDGKSPIPVTFDEDGSESVDLPNGFGEYTLVETTASAGYHLRGQEIKFTVGTDGKITLKEGFDYDGIASVSNNGLTITLTNELSSKLVASLNKHDDKGNKLKGSVVFKLTDLINSTSTDITVTDGGPQEFDLDEGEYELVEDSVPDGYDENKKASIRFTVKMQNNKYSIIPSNENEVSMRLPDDNKFEFTAVNYMKPVDIIIKKTDDKGKFISGAKFKITGSNNFLQENIEIDSENGFKVTLPGMGSYVLTEIESPNGYHGVVPINFEVNDKGEISFDTDYDYASIQGSTLTVKNTVDTDLSITLKKVDAYTKELIAASASFNLYVLDSQGNRGPETVIKTNNGSALLRLPVGEGSYLLEETSSPSGYRIDDLSFITFDVTYANGEYEIVIINNHNLHSNKNSKNSFDFTAENSPMQRSITIMKLSEDNSKPLAGAEFMVKDSSGNEIPVLLSSTIGKYTCELPRGMGRYVLIETTAPQNHHLLNDEIYFNVDVNGRIILEGSNSLVSVIDNGFSIAVKNKEIATLAVMIQKVDESNNAPIQSEAIFNLFKVDADGNRNGSSVLISTSGTLGSTDISLEIGHYELIETSVPTGYDINEAVHGYFTVSRTDNKYNITVDTANSSYLTVAETSLNSFIFTAVNTPTPRIDEDIIPPVTPPEDGGGDTVPPVTPPEDGGGDIVQPVTPPEDGGGDIVQPVTPTEDGAGDTVPPVTPTEDGAGDTVPPVTPTEDEGTTEEPPLEEVTEETLTEEEITTEETIEEASLEDEETIQTDETLENEITSLSIPDNFVPTSVPNVYLMLDEDGVPLGYFSPVIREDGTIEWIEVDEDGVPLGSINPLGNLNKKNPITGNTFHGLEILFILEIAAFLILLGIRKKFFKSKNNRNA